MSITNKSEVETLKQFVDTLRITDEIKAKSPVLSDHIAYVNQSLTNLESAVAKLEDRLKSFLNEGGTEIRDVQHLRSGKEAPLMIEIQDVDCRIVKLFMKIESLRARCV